MPLTSTHKSDLATVLASVASLRASLSPVDPEQKAVLQLIRSFEKQLPRISDARSK